MKRRFEPQTYVYLPCNRELKNTKDVKFLDISEDIQGRDMMTYECPECKEEHCSVVVGDR